MRGFLFLSSFVVSLVFLLFPSPAMLANTWRDDAVFRTIDLHLLVCYYVLAPSQQIRTSLIWAGVNYSRRSLFVATPYSLPLPPPPPPPYFLLTRRSFPVDFRVHSVSFSIQSKLCTDWCRTFFSFSCFDWIGLGLGPYSIALYVSMCPSFVPLGPTTVLQNGICPSNVDLFCRPGSTSPFLCVGVGVVVVFGITIQAPCKLDS